MHHLSFRWKNDENEICIRRAHWCRNENKYALCGNCVVRTKTYTNVPRKSITAVTMDLFADYVWVRECLQVVAVVCPKRTMLRNFLRSFAVHAGSRAPVTSCPGPSIYIFNFVSQLLLFIINWSKDFGIIAMKPAKEWRKWLFELWGSVRCNEYNNDERVALVVSTDWILSHVACRTEGKRRKRK